MLIDLPRNPGNYVAAAVRAGTDGKPLLVVQNKSPVPLGSISVTPVLVNSAGQIVQQARAVVIRGPVGPGEQVRGRRGTRGPDNRAASGGAIPDRAARVAQ